MRTLQITNRSIAAPSDRIAWTVLAIATVLLFLLSGPIHQDQAFHRFADPRPFGGLPNAWNVLSNLPFVAVGIAGLIAFKDTPSRTLFSGVLGIAFGSAFYHWAPSDARLVWDRLPMTVVFSTFPVLGWMSEGRRVSNWTLLALNLAGVGTVVYWIATGDLRPYAVVKFGPAILAAPSFRAAYLRRHLLAILLLFAAAQAAEILDGQIYSVFVLSGHTVKHFLAAAATYAILLWRSSFHVGGESGRSTCRVRL